MSITSSPSYELNSGRPCYLGLWRLPIEENKKYPLRKQPEKEWTVSNHDTATMVIASIVKQILLAYESVLLLHDFWDQTGIKRVSDQHTKISPKAGQSENVLHNSKSSFGCQIWSHLFELCYRINKERHQTREKGLLRTKT